ncbi:predicted protein [Histoplasma mississippiense (nom. inval.)]|nr:predicted protein [Histoplasma mississippiense (nom. inval.)]EDN03587.1 predicted protein [Histoplasma mississippiense (nom. inval.)]
MIAFEIAKLLEANGDEIMFLGSFNLPPRIKDRMRQLDWVEAESFGGAILTRNKLRTWITLAHKMQEAALEYEPSGSVASIDVFHAIPLKLVAANPTDWIENKLSKWADFSRELPRMHQVDVRITQ